MTPAAAVPERGTGEGMEKTVEKERKLLLSGVVILAFANLCVKIFGFLYKVPLNALLGDEMANINTAYAIYTLLYTVSTAGIPAAVALLVSSARAKGDRQGIATIFRTSMTALLVIGFSMMLLLLLFARPISLWNSGGDSYLCLLAIAPALFFVAAASVFRGYFQGFQRMTPTAVSELIEAAGKMLFGLCFVLLSLRAAGFTTHTAAALSIAGITLGIAAGTVYLALCYRRIQRAGGLPLLAPEQTAPEEKNGGRVLRGLLSVAVPIAVTSAMLNLSALVDSQLMRPLLARYYGDPVLAKAIYSDYSTGAVTLYNMPGVLIYPIAAAIVPYISSSLTLGRKKTAVNTMLSSFRVGALVSLPCALGLSFLATPILSFVFRGDVDMAKNAGPLLSVLAVCVFFAAVLTVTNAILQAVHKEKMPIISVAAGLAVKIAATLGLTVRFGQIGAPLGTLFFFITVVSLNLYFVRKATAVHLPLGTVFFRPFAAAALSVGAASAVFLLLFPHAGNDISLLVSIFLAVALYIPLVFLFGCARKEDLALLPAACRTGGFITRLRQRYALSVKKREKKEKSGQ